VIPPYINELKLRKIIRDAIHEDLGDGDHSTLSVIPAHQQGKAVLVAKENGIIAGLYVAESIFKELNSQLQIQFFKHDSDPVKQGDNIFEISGKVRDILSAERIVLNVIQRMSGIATATHRLVKEIRPYKTQLLDTRKTTPNLRILEKWAVKLGGGENHRMGLYDMIMLKDNHIDFVGGIKPAINAVKKYLAKSHKSFKIEIETRNLEEVNEVIETGGIETIMLDNMSIEDIKSAVRMIQGKYKTEASGNITEKNIKKVAACGVDYISVGAITHSVKSLDMSLIMKI